MHIARLTRPFIAHPARLLAWLILLAILLPAHTAYAETIPYKAYFERLRSLRTEIQTARESPGGDCVQTLHAAADRLDAITAVQLPDDRTISVDHTSLTAVLRASPCKPALALQILDGILLNQRTLLPPKIESDTPQISSAPNPENNHPGGGIGPAEPTAGTETSGQGEIPAAGGEVPPDEGTNPVGEAGEQTAEAGDNSGEDASSAGTEGETPSTASDNANADNTDETGDNESGNDTTGDADNANGSSEGNGPADEAEAPAGETGNDENNGSGNEAGESNAGNGSPAGDGEEGSTAAAGSEEAQEPAPNPTGETETDQAPPPDADTSPSETAGPEPASQRSLQIVTLIVLIALFFIATVVVYLFLSQNDRQTARKRPEEAETPEEAIDVAQALVKAGDYRAAMRHLFVALLLTLDERRILPYDPALTNRELLHRTADKPHLSRALRPVVNTFDRVWYGFEPLTAEDYHAVVHSIEQLQNAT